MLVRADVNPTWSNVYLGFGHSPARVRGLIANAKNNVNQIAARDGTVLTNAFAFDDLYQRFCASWRVAATVSLLSPCGSDPAAGTPSRTFYAGDLDPAI